MFNHETLIAENFTEQENVGAESRYEHRWCYQSLPKQGPLDSHWKSHKKERKKKKVRDICICLGNWAKVPQACLKHAEFVCLWADTPEQSTEGWTVIRQEKHRGCGSQENPEGIFCTPRGSGKSSCPATQRRETSWGGTNSSLHRRDTYGRQRAVCCPHDREEGVAQKQCSLGFFHHKHIFLIFHVEPSIFLQIFSTFQQSTEVWFSPKTAEGKNGRHTDTTDNRCTSPLNRTTTEKEVGLRNRVLPVLVTLLLPLEALLGVTEPAIA